MAISPVVHDDDDEVGETKVTGRMLMTFRPSLSPPTPSTPVTRLEIRSWTFFLDTITGKNEPQSL
jgi:hypothetical protein